MVPKICFGQMPQCVSSFEKQAGFSYQTNFFLQTEFPVVLYQREMRVWSVQAWLPMRIELLGTGGWVGGSLLGSYLLLHVELRWF